MIWYKNVFAQSPTVKILRFVRLVFGLTSSPFIVNGTVRIHLQKYLSDEHIKEIIQKLIGDLFVDDVTSSLNNQIDRKKFYETAIILKKAMTIPRLLTRIERYLV